MLAELHSNRNERKFNVYVLQCVNNELITTVPTLKAEPIHFFEEEWIHISFPMEKNSCHFNTQFSHVKKINDRLVYVFSIFWQGEQSNIRKDVRLHTDLPAFCSGVQEKDYSLATVLDVSKQGLKIETTGSLLRKTFHIVFEHGMKKETRRVKIAWTKKTTNGYQYGLQTVL